MGHKRIEAERYRMIPESKLLWLGLFISAILLGSICRALVANYSEQIKLMLDFFDKGWLQ